MSEGGDTEPPISSDEMTRFAAAKGISGECALCGHNDWTISTGKEDRSGFIPIVDEHYQPSPLVAWHRPVILMTCRNCGNTVLLSEHVVRSWLDENPDQSVDDNE